VRQHPYSVPQVLVVVALVVASVTRVRSAGRALAVIQECAGMGLESPWWSSTRLWVLRVGYDKLTRPKEQAEDWVWIVDHVVQIGPEKCLLIVGVRLSAVAAAGAYLAHHEVEPLALCPVTESTGEIVYQQ
jgi:hypothetical protein